MKVSVFGLGYVGSVTAVCLADLGHEVTGVDIHAPKVEQMRAGEPPVQEPDLETKLHDALEEGRLQLTMDVASAVAVTECSLVTVGTPSADGGEADLSAVQRCVESIATALRQRPSEEPHCVVIRSTVPPGTTGDLMNLAAEVSGRTRADTLLGGMNPEFLREGNAVEDFFDPEIVVLGARDDASHDVMERLYAGVDADPIRVDTREAELVKYVNNAFHGLKVAFANEVGRLSDALGIDGGQVMDILCRDRKLNISDAYLRPGFAFGGSCLPKDLRAFENMADRVEVDLPVVQSILGSNDRHIERALARVLAHEPDRLAILGAAFKAGTDDVRESPALRLARALLDRGHQVSIHDVNVEPSEQLGASRRYLLEILPEWKDVFAESVEAAVSGADLVVLTTNEGAHRERLRKLGNELPVLDLSSSDHEVKSLAAGAGA